MGKTARQITEVITKPELAFGRLIPTLVYAAGQPFRFLARVFKRNKKEKYDEENDVNNTGLA